MTTIGQDGYPEIPSWADIKKASVENTTEDVMGMRAPSIARIRDADEDGGSHVYMDYPTNMGPTVYTEGGHIAGSSTTDTSPAAIAATSGALTPDNPNWFADLSPEDKETLFRMWREHQIGSVGGKALNAFE